MNLTLCRAAIVVATAIAPATPSSVLAQGFSRTGVGASVRGAGDGLRIEPSSDGRARIRLLDTKRSEIVVVASTFTIASRPGGLTIRSVGVASLTRRGVSTNVASADVWFNANGWGWVQATTSIPLLVEPR